MLIIVCGVSVIISVILYILKIAMNSTHKVLTIFGENVKQYRKKLGISQEGLAFKANLHRTYIGMIERAEKNITLLNIEKIAVALNVRIIDLLKDA
jgi:ribosome-binding protein aMBF1 (putative translation factor)